MKALTLTFIHILFIFFSYAQDIIYTRTGKEIKVIIKEVNKKSGKIKYMAFDDQTGPLRNFEIKDILMIEYENGIKESFQNYISNDIENQNKSGSEKNKNNNVKIKGFGGIKVGYFFPFETEFYENFGNSFDFGADIGFVTKPGFGLAFSFEYLNKISNGTVNINGSRTSVDGLYHLMIFPVNFSFIYKINTQNPIISPYLAGGIGIYYYNETIGDNFVGYSNHIQSIIASAPIGLNFIAGLQVNFFFVEFKLSHIIDANLNLSNSYSTIDLDGFSISSGFRF